MAHVNPMNHLFASGHSVSVSTSVTTTDGLIRSSSHTLPTDQDNAASSHHVSHPMEVDDNKSSEVIF